MKQLSFHVDSSANGKSVRRQLWREWYLRRERMTAPGVTCWSRDTLHISTPLDICIKIVWEQVGRCVCSLETSHGLEPKARKKIAPMVNTPTLGHSQVFAHTMLPGHRTHGRADHMQHHVL